MHNRISNKHNNTGEDKLLQTLIQSVLSFIIQMCPKYSLICEWDVWT